MLRSWWLDQSRNEVGEDRNKHEDQDDQRADSTQRIAAYEVHERAEAAGDVGTGFFEFSFMIDDGHRASPGCGARCRVLLFVLNSGIEEGVGHVNEEVDEHHDERDEHHEVLHDRIVAPLDGFNQEAGDAGNVENRFRYNEAADQESRLDPDNRDHRAGRRCVARGRSSRFAPTRPWRARFVCSPGA